MCSIFGIFGLQPGDDIAALRRQALELSQKQRHRGPDWSGVYHDEGAILVHERLAIVDPAGGSQPLRSADGELVLAVNGEIYNHRELKAELVQDYAFQTGSDCEVINALYREDTPASFLNRLNGIFAFALWDKAKGRALIARDPIGVCPLYWGHDREGRLCVASEMKALAPICADVAQFPPGHYYDTATRALVKYYQKPWRDYAAVEGVQVSKDELREAFERAVHRQLMTDVPYAMHAIASRTTTPRKRGGRGCTPSPSAWRARPTWQPPKSRRRRWAPCTTASPTPSRKGSTRFRR